MNKLILVAVAGLCFGNIYAKNPKKDKAEEGFVFTTVKENPITSIKNQNRSIAAKTDYSSAPMLVILQPWIPGIRIAA